ncbi:MAG: putative flavoprotein (TIGR03862 family) [Maribacter sp.]|jgi:uncharacterized flavoprotein (TIGR03862 family)
MKKIIIIGGGSAGLAVAEMLCEQHEIHIYEKGKTIGRKFLVAGNGGFNLTNHAQGEGLIKRYSPRLKMRECLENFDGNSARKWLENLGVPTYVGSSGRVFPEEGIKPIHLLQRIKDKLLKNDVQFHFHHEFVAFSKEGIPIIKHAEKEFQPEGDYYIFALGGASWSVTGSDGKWRDIFDKKGIKTIDFQSSNCGINIHWNNDFKNKYEGMPLKNIKIKIDDFTVKGEALITQYGLEGNAIYPIIPKVRNELNIHKNAFIHLDLKPNNSIVQLQEKIKDKNIKTKNYAYIFNLNKSQLALIKQFSKKEEYINPLLFIKLLKKLKIPIHSLRPLEEAISTVGGISWKDMNDDFSLKDNSNIFIIGEMLDWDAPTGGFLLQACFSMAHAVAKAITNPYK